MKEVITYKRLGCTSSMGEGIRLAYSFYSFEPKEIDRLERLFRENIRTALVIDSVMTDLGEQEETVDVDAIPINFLKEKIALCESWGCYGYAKGLQSAIDEWEWEKKNEKE